MKTSIPLTCIFAQMLLNSCNLQQPACAEGTAAATCSWQTILQDKLPLLGHRNWVVITDMAYPLQAKTID